jgi:hypothetical protein
METICDPCSEKNKTGIALEDGGILDPTDDKSIT